MLLLTGLRLKICLSSAAILSITLERDFFSRLYCCAHTVGVCNLVRWYNPQHFSNLFPNIGDHHVPFYHKSLVVHCFRFLLSTFHKLYCGLGNFFYLANCNCFVKINYGSPNSHCMPRSQLWSGLLLGTQLTPFLPCHISIMAFSLSKIGVLM